MSVLLVIRDAQKAASMLFWGLSFAKGQGTGLDLLWLEEGDTVPETMWELWGERQKLEEWSHIEADIQLFPDVAVRLAHVSSISYYKSIQRAVKSEKPTLLIAGLHRSENMDPHHKLVHQLLDEVFCAVIILRATQGESPSKKVLLPCAGGPHSRRAIRLVANSMGKQATALFVEPDVGEISADVGEVRLRKILYRAGVDPDSLEHKVIVSDSVSSAVGAAAQKGDYGLMLIGASGSGTIRRKLFGTIPEKVLRGERAMDVGIIRGERPVGHRVREVFENWLHLSIPQLNRGERVTLFGEIEDKARWSFDFGALMILATTIAGLGLLANSGAVVIGAMLVAPLMMPLLGGGLALVQGNLPLWKRSQAAVLMGFFSALLIGCLLGLVANWLDMPLTDQLTARGKPTPLDLGVAFVSGIAASYCLARPKLSGALAGVAIAAALVPPIATAGICLSLGHFGVARGASLLFGTNVVAIVLGAGVSFFFAGIRGGETASGVWSKRMFIIFALLMAGLLVPLSSILVGGISGPRDVELVMSDIARAESVTLLQVRRGSPEDGLLVLEVFMEAESPVSAEFVQKLSEVAQLCLGKEVKVRAQTSIVIER